MDLLFIGIVFLFVNIIPGVVIIILFIRLNRKYVKINNNVSKIEQSLKINGIGDQFDEGLQNPPNKKIMQNESSQDLFSPKILQGIIFCSCCGKKYESIQKGKFCSSCGTKI